MNCPSCSEQLEPIDLGGLSLDRCVSCRIYWFDRREFEAFLKLVRPLKQKRKTEELQLPSPATCPRCESWTLEVGTWHEVPMARCSTCRGLLIGYDGIRDISSRMGLRSKRERGLDWPEAHVLPAKPGELFLHVADRLLDVD